MPQELIVYVIIALAMGYVTYRIYSSFKKKEACAKCELMEAVEKTKT